jgi:Ca2+-transporting ATPase
VGIFFSQFAELMIVLLAVAAVISALIGEWTDSALIGVIVLANAVVGAAQEWRAERAVAALKELSQPTVRVWREGRLVEMAAGDLVPGDVVELRGGDFVPADCRLIDAFDLQTDEAPLTGESLPVDKSTETLSDTTPLPDRRSMAFAGTAVTQSRPRVVTSTGMYRRNW